MKVPKLLPFVLLTLLIFVSLVSGISFPTEVSGQWTSFGFDRWATSGFNYPSSTFTAGNANGTNFTFTASVVAGGNFQPIAYDWDSDGDVEIIAAQGTTLNIYNPASNSLVLEATYALGGTVGVQGWCGEDTTLGKYCVFNSGSNLVTLSYNGATVSSLGSASFAGRTLESGLQCFSDSTYTIPYCFALTSNATSRIHLMQYRADTDDDLSYFNFATEVAEAGNAGVNWKPLVSDFDYDGEMEISWYGDQTSDLYIFMAKWNSTTNVVSAETSFSVDGRVVVSGTPAVDTGGFFAYDLDSANDEEICISYEINTPLLAIECFNADGTNYDTATYSSSAADKPSNLLYGDVDGDSIGEVVLVYLDATIMKVRTYDAEAGSLVSNGEGTFYTGSNVEDRAILSRVNEDATYDLIMAEKFAYFNGSGEINATDSKNIVPDYVAAVNFNKDAQMDYVAQSINALELYTMGTGGLPTVSSISLNPTLANNGFYNYNPTVCKGTTVEFKALECVGGSFDSTCTYINTDTSANERIHSSCDSTINVNGSYDSANPSVNCTFNTVGIFSVPLYMQDPATANFFGVATTLTMTVVDGVSGVDCDAPQNFITQPSGQTAVGTSQAGVGSFEDFFNLFAGGSDIMRMIFGLILIVGLAWFGWESTKTLFFGGVMGVLGLVIAVLFRLISIWLVILLAMLMALPLLFKWAFSGGNTGAS